MEKLFTDKTNFFAKTFPRPSELIGKMKTGDCIVDGNRKGVAKLKAKDGSSRLKINKLFATRKADGKTLSPWRKKSPSKFFFVYLRSRLIVTAMELFIEPTSCLFFGKCRRRKGNERRTAIDNLEKVAATYRTAENQRIHVSWKLCKFNSAITNSGMKTTHLQFSPKNVRLKMLGKPSTRSKFG